MSSNEEEEEDLFREDEDPSAVMPALASVAEEELPDLETPVASPDLATSLTTTTTTTTTSNLPEVASGSRTPHQDPSNLTSTSNDASAGQDHSTTASSATMSLMTTSNLPETASGLRTPYQGLSNLTSTPSVAQSDSTMISSATASSVTTSSVTASSVTTSSVTPSSETASSVTASSVTTSSATASSATTSTTALTDGEHDEQLRQTGLKRKLQELYDHNKKLNKVKAEEMEKEGVSEDEEEDAGSCCTICFEGWTNSGDHRIASLRCGHFFGFSCIEKWLKGGKACPNCNEKATRKDIRLHYVAKLKAIDTSEKDRAVTELEKFKVRYRQLELEHGMLKVTNRLQAEEIEKLKSELSKVYSGLRTSPSSSTSTSVSTAAGTSSSSSTPSSSLLPASGASSDHRLLYQKRLELIKENPTKPGCRVMTFNPEQSMLVVSQPSFTVLAPGFGVRRINVLDLNNNSNSYVALHKDVIRDLAFNPSNPDQLLSVSQDKTIKLTNISSCSEIVKYVCESEVWSCAWNWDDPFEFFVGTKRSQILIFDTRKSIENNPNASIDFPVTERRPIISLAYVPACQRHEAFPVGGILVQTLGSVWFFERRSRNDYVPFKLPIDGLFWSMRFDVNSRMIIISTKPGSSGQPSSRHIVAALTRISLGPANFACSVNVVMDHSKGGTFAEKSFLRAALFPGFEDNRIICAYSKGSRANDHKAVIQEVGSDRIIQELPIRKPILDICPLTDNAMAFLTEHEVFFYKWSE